MRTPTTVDSYEAARFDADRVGLVIDGHPTAEVCKTFWEEGSRTHPSITSTCNLRPLTGCVANRSVVVVFLGDRRGFCRQLAHAAPDSPQYPNEPDSVGAASDDIRDFMLKSSCEPLAGDE